MPEIHVHDYIYIEVDVVLHCIYNPFFPSQEVAKCIKTTKSK